MKVATKTQHCKLYSVTNGCPISISMPVKPITIESLYSLLYHTTAYMMVTLEQQVKEFQKEYEAMVRKSYVG